MQPLRKKPDSAKLPNAAGMLDRVRSEAAELRNFTLSFLSLLLYVGIIIASTTHEQLLRDDPVNLPLLNVNVPITGFYRFMPVLLFFVHLYILVQHYLFSQLVFRFRAALLKESPAVRSQLRRSLGNLPFVHWLAGLDKGFMQLLMAGFTVVSLIVWPVWTFWWLQATFLPYHDVTAVLIQRSSLVIDVLMLLYLWGKTLNQEDSSLRWWLPAFLIVKYVWVKQILSFWRNREDFLKSLYILVLNFLSDVLMIFSRWLLAGLLVSALFFSICVSTLPYPVPDIINEQEIVKLATKIGGKFGNTKKFLVEEAEHGKPALKILEAE